MKVLQIQYEQLEQIRDWACHNKHKFPCPIYLEFKNYKIEKGANLLIIKYGKCFDYFTRSEVFLHEDVDIENIKIILEYDQSDLNLNNIRKAQTVSNINLENIVESGKGIELVKEALSFKKVISRGG